MAAHQPGAITGETAVEEILRSCPAAAEVFIRWRLHCVGCEIAPFETLADVCRIYHRPLAVFLDELRRACLPNGQEEAADRGGDGQNNASSQG